MSNIQAVTKQECQELLNNYHLQKRVVKERDRADGELYEFEVYYAGHPPTVYDTFVLYSHLGQFTCYALVDRITNREYELGSQQIIPVLRTVDTPIGFAYVRSSPNDVFKVENVWYAVVSRSGSVVPSESECAKQLELGKQRLIPLRQETIEQALKAEAQRLEQAQKQAQKAEAQRLEQAQKAEAQRLKEKQKAEAQRLEKNRNANLVQVLSALRQRLIRDAIHIQTFPILEKYRPHLQHMQEAQQSLSAQTMHNEDLETLETLAKEAIKYEARHLKRLRDEYQYHRQQQKQDRYQQQKQDRYQRQQALDIRADTYERDSAAITYDAASDELHTIRMCVEQGVSSQVTRNRAIHLRTRCVKSLGATMTFPASTPTAASGGGATAGAIIGGMLGLLGGPVGIIVGAIAGGLLGNSADNDGKSPPSSQAIPKQRHPWAALIETLDDIISKLPAE